MPGGVRKGIEMTGTARLRTLYLRPDLAHQLRDECCVLSVSNLLRELVLEVLRLGMLREDSARERNLARVLVDQMRLTPAAPLEIRWPGGIRRAHLPDADACRLSWFVKPQVALPRVDHPPGKIER